MSNEENDFLNFLYEEDLYLIKGDEPEVQEEAEVLQNKQESDSTNVLAEIDISEHETAAEAKSDEPADATDDQSAEIKEPASAYPKKTSDLLIIFENTDAPEMHPNDREFLSKVLGAVNIQLKDCDLQNVDAIMPNASGYQKVICFTKEHGIEGAPQKYALGKVADGTVLVADDLSAIAAAVPLKKQLWAALQQMFEV